VNLGEAGCVEWRSAVVTVAQSTSRR